MQRHPGTDRRTGRTRGAGPTQRPELAAQRSHSPQRQARGLPPNGTPAPAERKITLVMSEVLGSSEELQSESVNGTPSPRR